MNSRNQKSKWKLWYTQLLLFVIGILLLFFGNNTIAADFAPGFFVAALLLEEYEKDRKLLSDIESFLRESPSKYNGQRA